MQSLSIDRGGNMEKEVKIIGVLLGDACGIGPEIVVKALSKAEVRNRVCWFMLGDSRILDMGETVARKKLDPIMINDFSEVIPKAGEIYLMDLKNFTMEKVTPGVLSPHSGKVTGDTLKEMVSIARKNPISGILYGPFNKEALQRGGHSFEDETHFYANLFGCENQEFGEINIMDDLWVSRITSHVPMKDVSKLITKDLVLRKIHFANEYLLKAGYKRPKIIVAAYNPHGGEGGLLGNEEIESIRPAIKEAAAQGVDVIGPYPADTIFLRRQTLKYTCLLSVYHDQAQLGIKLLGFHKGVTLSAGFPIPLATPAHGTAFDIAGKGIANESATLAAINILFRLSGVEI
jgi:4-hydroxythreonine-4-phosphate dehydrogenase